MMAVPDVSLADVLRSTSDPRWLSAYRRVLQLLGEPPLSQHARFRGLDRDARDELRTELANHFWELLKLNPAKLAARSVKGPGAVVTELHRFLNDSLSLEQSADDARVSPRRNLYRKLSLRLRGGNPFTKVGQSRSATHQRWFLLGVAPAPTPLPDDQLTERLPRLVADLVPQRSDQVAPLATPEELATHCTTLLELRGTAASTTQLTNWTWASFEPSLDSFYFVRQALPEGADPATMLSVDAEGADDDLLWRAEIELIADRVARRVPALALRAMWHKARTPQATVEQTTTWLKNQGHRCEKSTVHKLQTKVLKVMEEEVQRRALPFLPARLSDLLERVVETGRAGGFEMDGGDHAK